MKYDFFAEDYSSAYNCSSDTDRLTGENGLEKACTLGFTCKNELTNFLVKCVNEYNISDDEFEVLKKYVRKYDMYEDYGWWSEE